MVGKKKGTKNLRPMRISYNRGEPAINLCLAVLAHAKQDALKAIPKVIRNKYWEREKAFILSGKKMWHAFRKSEFYGRRAIAPLDLAWWVCEYIQGVRNV